ncbi:hypothetical protein H0266_14895 [Halobacillus locisalis]|uniref:Uncharacterized protein n=1 Tax=Halobacillus locisalis TaxID=220753 RepID=A0A838CVK9_9BACI|nr:hypothetical protein [Halobacillus locisalis]MBA2176182.1 hypothetical protein [Halobacillus locisalis]
MPLDLASLYAFGVGTVLAFGSPPIIGTSGQTREPSPQRNFFLVQSYYLVDVHIRSGHMEEQELKRLRKKQYLKVTIAMITVGAIALLLGNHISSKTGFLLLLISVVIALAVEAYGFFTGRYITGKDTRKLIAYEKGKLGERAFRREKRMGLISQVFVMLMIGFQYVIADSNSPFFPPKFAWVIIVLLSVMLIMMNWSLRSRAKRIDVDGPVQGKAVRKNTLKIALITGVVFTFTSILVFFIMLSTI